jgi:chromosome partitioning protein
MDVLQTHICQRIAYAESAAVGSTVIEDPMKDTLASQEINSLTEEILEKYSR